MIQPMLMNHQTVRSLLCGWTLHYIIEDWMTYTKDKSIGLDDHYHPPDLYHLLSNNQQSPPWFNNFSQLQVTQFVSSNLR